MRIGAPRLVLASQCQGARFPPLTAAWCDCKARKTPGPSPVEHCPAQCWLSWVGSAGKGSFCSSSWRVPVPSSLVILPSWSAAHRIPGGNKEGAWPRVTPATNGGSPCLPLPLCERLLGFLPDSLPLASRASEDRLLQSPDTLQRGRLLCSAVGAGHPETWSHGSPF